MARSKRFIPNQFILAAILNYHEVEDKKIVDEVAPIRTISEKDANKEFFKASAS